MYFNFTNKIDRSNTGSAKWLAVPKNTASNHIPPLSVADMELPVAQPIKEACVQAAEHGIYGYTIADKTYTDAVTGWFSSRQGWNPHPEWIVITPGVVNAISTAIRAFTKENEKVLIMPPVYHPFFSTVKDNKRQLLISNLLLNEDTMRYDMNFSELKKLSQDPKLKLILLCSPHNPCSRIWSQDELEQLYTLFEDRDDVIFVSDEIHGDLVSPRHEFISVGTLDTSILDKTIICTAVSKTFNLAGLSCSNIFIPNKTLRETYRAQSLLEHGGMVPYFARAATIAAYTECSEWVDALNKHVSENAKFLKDALTESFPKLKFSPLEGTYLLWNDWRAYEHNPDKLEDFFVKKAGVILNNGSMFGATGNGFMRWNLACPRSVLEDAAQALLMAKRFHGI